MFYRNEIHANNTAPTRIHYAWFELEEYRPDGGMWATPATLRKPQYIQSAFELMSNPDAFVESMRQALNKWPKSVAVALTTPNMNHRAWLGHAGCYLATGSPEETTRLGWHKLDENAQRAANTAADQVIAEWHKSNLANCQQLEMFDA